jgi:hypothetical protein
MILPSGWSVRSIDVPDFQIQRIARQKIESAFRDGAIVDPDFRAQPES